MKRLFIYIFYTVFVLFNYAKGQTAIIENIKKKIATAPDNDKKLEAVFELCEQRHSLSADTLNYYGRMAKQLAIAANDKNKENWADYYMISGQVLKGDINKSIIALDTALAKATQFNDAQLMYNLMRLKAVILVRKNELKEAMTEFYSILHLAETTGDTSMHIAGTNGIGWIYMEMNQNRDAINWFLKSIHASNNRNYYRENPIPYANLSATYNTIGKNDSSEFFGKIAIELSRETQNLSILANALNIIAQTYIDTHRDAIAEEVLNEALKFREQIGDPFYIVSDMMQMALFYASQKQTAKGIELCNKGIAMARQYGLDSKLPILYEALAENYKAAGDYKKYGEVLKDVMQLKDSLYQVNSATALAEIQTKYNVQLKENIIARQKFDLEKHNYLLSGVLILLVLVVAFSAMVFYQYKKRQRVKIEAMQKQERQAMEQAVYLAEENQRKRIAADIHDNLGMKASVMLYSAELLLQEKTKNETMLSAMRDTSKEILLTLRDTLWAMKAADIEARDVWFRIINFIKQTGYYFSHIKITTSGAAPEEFLINSGVALNTLLIVQEAINNAIKHSTAADVFVKSEPAGPFWQLIVEDNGIGFDVEAMQKKQDSYGLSNMIGRAKAANLYIEIKTKPLQGTVVILRVPAINGYNAEYREETKTEQFT